MIIPQIIDEVIQKGLFVRVVYLGHPTGNHVAIRAERFWQTYLSLIGLPNIKYYNE